MNGEFYHKSHVMMETLGARFDTLNVFWACAKHEASISRDLLHCNVLFIPPILYDFEIEVLVLTFLCAFRDFYLIIHLCSDYNNFIRAVAYYRLKRSTLFFI